ncbi:hypothetical protein BDD43_0642 [Mucilaginibacter gracilis]|uniref:ABC-2 family transporter n=1 Tax=Mucilaginibacter gracilis TaxID=423350 RepID=A0A495IW12_9SPHI|nr:ABC transporter permease [Mucilaginibacter gracilis]RKR80521.1 hypothetical protein BDD43_0642 [Mucilaginibacter gracilis]
MSSFSKIFSAEVIKVKNTFAIFLLVLLALAIPLFVSMEYLKNADKVIIHNSNPWSKGWKRTIIGIAIFAGPCVIIMLNALLMNIEHKTNSWKNLFTLPVSPGIIYLSKLCVSLLILTLFFLFSIFFFFICAAIIGVIIPNSGFFQYSPDIIAMFSIAFRTFISLATVFAIHFWLSFRLKNMFIGMAVGLMLMFFAMMTYPQMETVLFFPYNYGELTVFKYYSYHHIFAIHEILSLALFAMISCGSYWDFTRNFKG